MSQQASVEQTPCERELFELYQQLNKLNPEHRAKFTAYFSRHLQMIAALQQCVDVMGSARYYAVGQNKSATIAVREAIGEAIEQAREAISLALTMPPKA